MNKELPRDTAAFEVREAAEQSGCPVCRLALRAVGHLIDSVAYEQVNDPGLRKQLRSAHGFCNAHAYRWLNEARSVLGTALIYRDVLRSALQNLERDAHEEGPRGGVLAALLGRPDGTDARLCPACRIQRESEQRYLGALLESLADPEVSAAFKRSEGLCLAHVLDALRHGGAGVEQVVAHSHRRIAELLGHLDEVIRKEDYRFRDEARSPAERAAPRQAVAWAAGAEGLVAIP